MVAQTGPRKVSQFGEGARQAPVLPPIVVAEVGRLMVGSLLCPCHDLCGGQVRMDFDILVFKR